MFYLKWVTFVVGQERSQAGDYILSHDQKMWDQNGEIVILRCSIFDTRVLARIPESVIWRNYFGDNDLTMISTSGCLVIE